MPRNNEFHIIQIFHSVKRPTMFVVVFEDEDSKQVRINLRFRAEGGDPDCSIRSLECSPSPRESDRMKELAVEFVKSRNLYSSRSESHDQD